jgi:hypothetical protein
VAKPEGFYSLHFAPSQCGRFKYGTANAAILYASEPMALKDSARLPFLLQFLLSICSKANGSPSRESAFCFAVLQEANQEPPLMEKEPWIRLIWHGHETIASLPVLLEQTEQIGIDLPVNYNHALFRRLHPQAHTAGVENIDRSGGPELLAEIAAIAGLEGFAALTEALTTAGATVQVVSPPQVIISRAAANRQA